MRAIPVQHRHVASRPTSSAKLEEIKSFLEAQYAAFNSRKFIGQDPIQIPHLFSNRHDIEIAGFLTATIAWGNRTSIITNARKLMSLMDDAPHEFVTGHSPPDLARLRKFVHRTFNATDCVAFVRALRYLYEKHGGLEGAFCPKDGNDGMKNRILQFRRLFFETQHPKRTEKHVSDPSRKSSAKRLCMFLRWMVRHDRVDLGIWKKITPAELFLPLDVHSGRVARELGILKRKQNDWQAVEEVTEVLKRLDPSDPIKYDLALFGTGVTDLRRGRR